MLKAPLLLGPITHPADTAASEPPRQRARLDTEEASAPTATSDTLPPCPLEDAALAPCEFFLASDWKFALCPCARCDRELAPLRDVLDAAIAAAAEADAADDTNEDATVDVEHIDAPSSEAPTSSMHPQHALETKVKV